MNNSNKKQLKELQTGGPGFWMGVAALVGSIFLVPAGLICGIIGKKESEAAGYKNNFALAGIIISSVLMGLGLLTWIIFAVFAGSIFNKVKDVEKDSINAASSIQQRAVESASTSQQAALDAAADAAASASQNSSVQQSTQDVQAAAQAALDAARARLNQ